MLYVSRVIYRDYHEGPAFTDELDPYMHKRTEYSSENELRLLNIDDAHCIALFNGAPTVAELDEHLSLDWPGADVIEQIVLSPYGSEGSRIRPTSNQQCNYGLV
jgi:hypothetical protein